MRDDSVYTSVLWVAIVVMALVVMGVGCGDITAKERCEVDGDTGKPSGNTYDEEKEQCVVAGGGTLSSALTYEDAAFSFVLAEVLENADGEALVEAECYYGVNVGEGDFVTMRDREHVTAVTAEHKDRVAGTSVMLAVRDKTLTLRAFDFGSRSLYARLKRIELSDREAAEVRFVCNPVALGNLEGDNRRSNHDTATTFEDDKAAVLSGDGLQYFMDAYIGDGKARAVLEGFGRGSKEAFVAFLEDLGAKTPASAE